MIRIHQKIIFLTVISFFCSGLQANAQSKAGAAEYAMLSAKWPCALARESENAVGLKQLRKAVLWNTFGRETACLKQYFSDPRLVSFQMHLINEVCQRDNDCGSYEFLHQLTPQEYNQRLIAKDDKLLKRLKRYLAEPSNLVNANLKPGMECLISPGLESNLSTAAAQVLIDTVSPFFPSCKIVWNPVGNNRDAKPIGGTVFELHGSDPVMSPPCNADLDGVDISFPSRPAILPLNIASSQVPAYIKRYSKCSNSFLWIAEYNGITKGSFVDPRQRSEFPDLTTFNLVNQLIADSWSAK